MEQYSIKDIAKLSGVSTATVSRVINHKGKYSEQTKEKVLKIIEQTGYNIDVSAQSLRTNITHTIGILVPDIKNPFFADLVQKIENHLFNKNYSTFICDTNKKQEKEKAYLQMLEKKKVDGVIVISGSGKRSFKFESSIKKIPYICIDREPQNFNDTIFISSNHYQGAYDATTYLINKNANHLLIISDRISTSSESRLAGFKDALKQNGLKYSKANNYLLLKKDIDFDSFISKHPETNGIFAINDNLAIRVLNRAKFLHIDIPNQIQIIGFDDIPAASLVNPSLTTIAQNTKRIAKNTVDSILSSIEGQGDKGSKLLIPVKMVIRQSTK